MQWRRSIALCSFVLASALAATPSLAQLAPTGAHYGGRSSDTGHGGGVNSSGGYAASIPLDLPGARGGMLVPVQIVYGEHRVGAAGLGWDVPLSFVRREATFAYSRPLAIAGAAPQVRDAVSLTLNGRSFNLVRTPTGWAAQRDAPDLEIRQQGDTWLVFDGKGWTYTFAPAASSLVGSGIWHLASVTGQGGNKVILSYAVSTPAVAGVAGAVALDLTSVQYNNDPSGCFKNTVTLGYDSPAATPLSLSVAGNKPFVRMHKLTTVTVSGKATCGTSETIRSYQLSYQPDADTKLPQLASVQMTGRQGTPEAAAAVPIGRYVYGSASASGQLNYASPDLTGTLGGNALGQTQSGAGPETGMFSGRVPIVV